MLAENHKTMEMFTQKILLTLATASLLVSCEGDIGSSINKDGNLETLNWEIGVVEQKNLDANIENVFQYAETTAQILDRAITLRIECSEKRELLLQMEGELLPDVAVPTFIESQGAWLNQITGLLINHTEPTGSPASWHLNFYQDSSNKNLFSTFYDTNHARSTLFSADFSLRIQLVGNHFLRGSLKKLSSFFDRC